MKTSKIDFADAEECSICLESFTKSRPATVTSCNHKFHPKCIQKWQHGNECPVCKTALSSKKAACQGRKKRKSADEGTAGTSEEPRSSQSKCTPEGSKRKETSEPSLRRSTRSKVNNSGGKAGDVKGTKGTYEEEELGYVPEWDVCTTDHPSDPLVAKNLAEGVVLPAKAAELAEMDDNLLMQGTYLHCVTALNFVTTTLTRATETSEREEDLKIKIVEKDAHITELETQLRSTAARASVAEARVEEVEAAAAREQAQALRVSKMNMIQKDAYISQLKNDLWLLEARAMAAEAALKNVEAETELRVATAASKAVQEFKSSEQYKDGLLEYAFSSFNEVYAVMKKRLDRWD